MATYHLGKLYLKGLQYDSGLVIVEKNISKAIEEIENEIPASAEKDTVLNFIRNSKSGIMKGFAQLNEENS